MWRQISLLRRLLGGQVVRLILAVTAGVGLATALGLAYPVQRELDTASFSHAAFASQAQLGLPAVQGQALSDGLSSQHCLATVWVFTSFSSGGREAGPADLYGLSPDCDQSLTPFPDQTRLAYRPVAGDRWIDLTGDAAHDLGASAGDTISVYTGPGQTPLQLVVRGVYAVRPGMMYGGRTSASALFAAQPDGTASYHTLFSADPADKLTADLARPELRSLMEAKVPTVVTTRSELLAVASGNSAVSLGLVRAIATLALGGGMAFAAREVDVFRRRLVDVLNPIHELGGDAPRLLRTWTVLGLVLGVVAAYVGVWLGTLPYVAGWLGPVFPAALEVPLAVAAGGGLAAYLVLGIASFALAARRFGGAR